MGYLDQLEAVSGSAGSLLHAVRGLHSGLRAEMDELADAELVHARDVLARTVDNLHEALVLARGARETCDTALAAWRARNRFTPEGLEATIAGLRTRGADNPAATGRALLAEVAGAVHGLAVGHAIALLRAFPDWLSLPDAVLDDLDAWNDGEVHRGREAVRMLNAVARDRRAAGRTSTLLALTEAWLSCTIGDPASAADILDRLVDRSPADALLRVERSGLRLLLGDKESAAEDAQRAIELDGSNPECHVQAGAVAEASAEYADATELYTEAARQLGSARFIEHRAVSFVQRTGMFYLAWARALHESGSQRAALQAVDDALATGIAGTSTYPEAAGYDLRWRLLEALDSPRGAVAAAAFDAGHRHLWNDDLDQAIEALRVAVEGGASVPRAGWYLADALLQASAGVDVDHLAEAAEVWDRWRADVGPPASDEATAYAIRGLIGESLARLTGSHSAPAEWSGVLLCEKGLVLDPFNTYSWGQLGRFFRALSMRRLALDAVEIGYSIDPDDNTVLGERVAVLADLGRTQEALDTLERIRVADADHWLSGLKAVLLLRSGRPAETLSYLELPMSSGRDLDWYSDVRAACLVDLGRLDDAVAELHRVLLAPAAHSGPARCRRAYAFAVLGDLAAAREELSAAMQDESLGEDATALASVWVALAEGERDRAVRLIEKVLALAPTVAFMDITLRRIERALALFEHAGRPVDDASGLVNQARGIAGEQTIAAQDADRELDAATQAHQDWPADSVPRLALVATRARRRTRQTRPREASELYEQLLGTEFEPEATRGLVQTLEDELRQVIAQGDVHTTRAVYDRLAAMGAAPAHRVEVVVAEALRARGEHLTAVNMLSALVAEIDDPDERLRVLELLGEVALFAGLPAVAEPALTEAFDLAVGGGDASRAAQISVRLALALVRADDWTKVATHLGHALEQWVAADTWDPRGILEVELRWLIKAIPGGVGSADLDRLRDAVDLAASLSAVDARADPDDEERTDKEVTRLAHFLWERDGRPNGRDREHWFVANRLVRRGPLVRGYTADDVARIAHFLWERDGRADGRDREHWFRAMALIRIGLGYFDAKGANGTSLAAP